MEDTHGPAILWLLPALECVCLSSFPSGVVPPSFYEGVQTEVRVMILVAESISQKGGSDHFWARQQQQQPTIES